MNFLDALNTRVADIERPKLLPTGTYRWAVNKPHKESTSKNGEWSTVEIFCIPKEPYEDAEDVDADDLSAFGDLKSGVNSIRFMFNNAPEAENDRTKTLWNLRRFLLDTLKVEGEEDSTIKELLAKAVGAEFLASVVHAPGQNEGDVFVNLKNWAPVE